MSSLVRHIFVGVAAGVATGLLIALLLVGPLRLALLREAALALVAVDPPPARVDAVAIHGGGDNAGLRELPAVAMLRAGRTTTLVPMGGLAPPGDPDRTYAGAVERRLRALGAAPGSILRLDVGATTTEELRALRRLAEQKGWRRIAISSSPWHTRRVALSAARAFAGSAIRYSVIAAPEAEFDLEAWWRSPEGAGTIGREWLKLLATVVGAEALAAL